jgi:hypothetical protein
MRSAAPVVGEEIPSTTPGEVNLENAAARDCISASIIFSRGSDNEA